ncbi:hypothetical protein A1O3_05532 [Capronia epimyces CBS 606.96]|uniref:Alcohol dehydrogenase n=1 Tax=Capronia epimyces CBS 606.96 TaxID=1182542 RepID=W9XWE8_9EURO|nr:uncharacterized protein A1O3_05532 [Capronia epimyces CBS 606.96]EXJ84857.1 hypothetical protein A1O3_05532 [Capronia epimyces CBS 606.96]
MSEEFPIELQFGKTLRTIFYSQFFCPPPYPSQSFANQTVIVTGSNVGLGFEAARHFYRLNCTKLILAVRTVAKGQTAKEDIVRSVKHRTDADAIEVWSLDLTSTKSTLAFAERVKKELTRVDVLVENAGIISHKWTLCEGFEQGIQVNVINTLLLGMSLLPKLRETKDRFADSYPHLVIVTSEALRFTKFKQINDPDIYQSLNDESRFDGFDGYCISKLIEVLFIRELVNQLDPSQSSTPPVIIDLVNPGMSYSSFARDASLPVRIVDRIVHWIAARSTEVGSRTLVHGASAQPDSHGEYMSDGQNQAVEKWIYGEVGSRAQRKVFEQTMKVLETRNPGIGKAAGL